MNLPDLDTFWRLVAESRLIAADEFERLRRACTAGDPVAAAQWLVGQGALSTWQARRLARGDQGPFFIGEYRLMARVDAEGPGLLFRVCEEGSGRRLQLRLLERSLCKERDVWTGIVRRATIAHAARSPILSKTIAVDKAGSHRFILCEDIPLKTLADELAAEGSLPVAAAVRIAVEVARAAAEVHQLDGVHGAISLAALRREPRRDGADPRAAGVRLAQFPLAGDPHLQPPRLPLELKDRIDALGQQACFIAPELAAPSAECTERSDIYAIGCLVHALVNGEPAGWQGDPRRTLAHAAKVGLPPLVVPGGPASLVDVVAMMTARDPQLRYASAIEAADALAACVGMPPQSLVPPPSVIPAAVMAGDAGSAVQAAAPRSASMTISPPPFAEPSALVPVIDTAGPARPVATRSRATPARGRQKRGRKQTALWATAGLLGVAALGLVTLVFVLKQQGTSTKQVASTKDSKRQAVADGPTVDDRSTASATPDGQATGDTMERGATPEGPVTASSPNEAVDLVASDTLPWGPPTSGPPPPLAYLPAGSQLILIARPADLVADDEGRLFVAALGPQVAAVLGLLKQVSGCGLERIEEVQAGWQADASGTVLGGYAIRLTQPADEQAIVAALEGLEATKAGAETVHAGSSLSLWLPTAEQGRVIVCGAPKLVQAIVASEAAAGPVGDSSQLRAALPPDMERLVGMLDRSRHVTLFGAPQYLRTEGRDMLTGSLTQLVDPLKLFFSDAVRAAALSLHFGDMVYVELDAVDSVDEPARVMAKNMKAKVDALAGDVEDWTAGLSGVQYGRKLVNRLPVMVGFLAANTRAGAEGRGVVVNAYLPRHAGHNIALAAELSLAQAGRSGPMPTATAAAGAAASKPTSAKQKLQQKTSLSFPRDTLEKSIQLLSEEIGLPIEILGNDLKLEGITKNQSFGLDEKNKPAEEILRVILMRANPDGKLVYVFRGAGDGDSLVITTRAAAAERGDPVPPVFATPATDADKK
jgi:serine/threonine protein kinase